MSFPKILPTKSLLSDFVPNYWVNYRPGELVATTNMRVKVIDLFCGAGGFSEGARQAGAEVVLAVDAWEPALQVHALNHPEAVHLQLMLGALSPRATWRLLSRHLHLKHGDWLHIHGSPPCQNLSGANRLRNTDEGLRLVRWFLDLVQATPCRSWTMEQVPHVLVQDLLTERGIPWRILEFDRYGVPQTRRRCMAGEGLDLDCLRPRSPPSFRDMLAKTRGWSRRQMSRIGIVSKNVFKKRRHLYVRTLDRVPPTVCANDSNFFVDRDSVQIIGKCSLAENRWLQTFPPRYRWDDGVLSRTTEQKLVGNAVPPLIAKQLIECVEE